MIPFLCNIKKIEKMAGFKKLILIQIISWLLCVAAGSYFISVGFDNAVSEAQKSAQVTVSKYINELSIDDLSLIHI